MSELLSLIASAQASSSSSSDDDDDGGDQQTTQRPAPPLHRDRTMEEASTTGTEVRPSFPTSQWHAAPATVINEVQPSETFIQRQSQRVTTQTEGTGAWGDIPVVKQRPLNEMLPQQQKGSVVLSSVDLSTRWHREQQELQDTIDRLTRELQDAHHEVRFLKDAKDMMTEGCVSMDALLEREEAFRAREAAWQAEREELLAYGEMWKQRATTTRPVMVSDGDLERDDTVTPTTRLHYLAEGGGGIVGSSSGGPKRRVHPMRVAATQATPITRHCSVGTHEGVHLATMGTQSEVGGVELVAMLRASQRQQRGASLPSVLRFDAVTQTSPIAETIAIPPPPPSIKRRTVGVQIVPPPTPPAPPVARTTITFDVGSQATVRTHSRHVATTSSVLAVPPSPAVPMSRGGRDLQHTTAARGVTEGNSTVASSKGSRRLALSIQALKDRIVDFHNTAHQASTNPSTSTLSLAVPVIEIVRKPPPPPPSSQALPPAAAAATGTPQPQSWIDIVEEGALQDDVTTPAQYRDGPHPLAATPPPLHLQHEVGTHDDILLRQLMTQLPQLLELLQHKQQSPPPPQRGVESSMTWINPASSSADVSIATTPTAPFQSKPADDDSWLMGEQRHVIPQPTRRARHNVGTSPMPLRKTSVTFASPDSSDDHHLRKYKQLKRLYQRGERAFMEGLHHMWNENHQLRAALESRQRPTHQ